MHAPGRTFFLGLSRCMLSRCIADNLPLNTFRMGAGWFYVLEQRVAQNSRRRDASDHRAVFTLEIESGYEYGDDGVSRCDSRSDLLNGMTQKGRCLTSLSFRCRRVRFVGQDDGYARKVPERGPSAHTVSC